MKALIEHLWNENREQIVERSRWNCHARGLHSIVFLESPGRTIRCFIATPEHELHLNRRATLKRMSIGFHPHHCNLTLNVIHGTVFNWEVELAPWPAEHFRLDVFRFRSALKNGGTAAFENGGPVGLRSLNESVLGPGDSLAMPANALHTVAVQHGQAAAWFVFEGRADDEYQPLCYSGARLDQMTFDHLYTRPTQKQIGLEIKKLLARL